MNEPMYFEIQADNPEALVRFYGEIFGWEGTREEHMPMEYWRLETEGITGAILKRPLPAPEAGKGTNAFTVSMEVTDFDTIAEKIFSLDGKEILPKFAIPGKCWQGYFVDPQGNTFGIFQVDENAA